MNNNENGACTESSESQDHDSILAKGFVDFFKRETVKKIGVVGRGMGKYICAFQTNDIDTVGFENSNELNKATETPFDWVMSFGEFVSPQSEDSFLANIHTNNTHGIVLSCEIKDGLMEQSYTEFLSKIRDLGYIHDIEVEKKMRKMTTVSSLKNTIMVFRKVYNYNQNGYFLCLAYNKPVHLDDNIRRLPNTYNIGGYSAHYRSFFNKSTKQDFMIDIGANMGLSACPILAMGNRVVCFEPESLNHEMLQHIKKYNHYENMYIEHCAVIGEKGKRTTTFYSNIHREDNSSVNELCCKGNVMPVGVEKKEVNSITLDEWYEMNKHQFDLRDLLLLKIDVQGGELDILKGSTNVLKSCSVYGKCQVELECDEGFMRILNINFDTINELMDNNGFKCIIRGYDSIFVPK